MFSYLKKNPVLLTIFLAMLLVAFAQIILLFIFQIPENDSFWFLIPVLVPLLLIIPVLFIRMRIPIQSLTTILANQTLSELKTVALKGGDLGKLADVIYGLVGKNVQIQSEFSELRKTYQEYFLNIEKLMEWLPCAAFIVKRNCNICNCNKKVLDFFGFDSLNQMPHSNLLEMLIESDRLRFQSFLDKTDNKPLSDTIIFKINDNEFSARVFIIPDTSRRTEETTFLVFVDGLVSIAKEKTADQNQGLFNYNIESVSRLAGGIAHDFNNILGAVSGYAEIIINRYSSDDKLKKYGSMILSATKRASGITQKLLQFARKNNLSRSLFDVNEPLSLMSDIFGLSKAPILVKYQLNAQDSYIYGDPDQFQNAITNIAVNAQEAMPSGGQIIIKTENVTIDQTISKSHLFTIIPGYYIVISVTDSGVGMDQQTLSHLFEPFYTSKDRSRNTGLGLACVYGIVKKHNGFIDVESKPDAGTTFTLYFPVCEEQRHSSSPIQSTDKRILLVDDEECFRDAIGETLTWLGFSVTYAESGNEAISILENSSEEYDLVILDMVMPGMNGKDCFSRMKEIKKDIKVLISTGFSKEIDQSMLDMGICGILMKPFESSQLTQAIYDALRK